MDITQFHALADSLFESIEEKLDQYIEQYDTDIDYETHGNLISITFENSSKIIINTQEPLMQIWMATRKQGYHFDFKNSDWVCSRSGQLFNLLFDEAVKEQMNHN